ncbi:MAG: aldose epimerase family protein [Prevotella sp.]|nr:aldose epimerase family protein [Prevotella sp.]
MDKSFKSILIAGLVTVFMGSCANSQNVCSYQLDAKKFDTVINKKPVHLFTMKNKNGMEVSITNFGGRIVQIIIPDKNGNKQDVVLGYDNIQQYYDIEKYGGSDFGAAIGRYANRINKGQITIGGKQIQLPQNNFGHCLHGGPNGWQYAIYDGKKENDSTITMSIVSPDGDANFPGKVEAKVTYTLTSTNALDIQYEATTDAETVINMTNHSYFNLNGDPTKNIENCILYVNADCMTPVNRTFMTTGEIVKMAEDDPFNFLKPKTVGKDINADNEQLKFGMGYDHNWCLNTYKDGIGNDKEIAASLWSPITGIRLDVYTNEPGIQVYTGNFLDGTAKGKKGIIYNRRAAICLETQKYPDTPNKPDWPTANLKPGETYKSHCVFAFSVSKGL